MSEMQTAAERVLNGVGVTAGIAIAPVHVEVDAGDLVRSAGEPADEARALREAMATAGQDLMQLAESVDEDAAAILEFQAVLLEDDELLAPVFAEIAQGAPADAAWRQTMAREMAAYSDGGDPVFAARASDLADLRDRVLRALCGASEAAGPRESSIVLATDLAPSRLLQFDPDKVAGIALVRGSRTSHVALIARARGIPMVTGLGDLAEPPPDLPAVLDVAAGQLILAPDRASLARARRRSRDAAAALRRAGRFAGVSVRAGDGEPVSVCVNIDHLSMLDAVDVSHCDGIGLARTEFLFAHGAPDEDTQVATYTALLRWAAGRPVTVRTLDAGGDKPVPGLTQPAETNPFLGVRGVRLSLRERALFRTQLRALLRAAVAGPLKVMVPMVTEPAEMDAVSALVEGARAELEAEGVAHAPVTLGMMVEVPAAALCASHFETAFYSIGSNDLIQYATASARDNPGVADLARSTHPGVELLIRAVVACGRELGREVSVCGDMASDPDDARRLVALGVRTLSVAPATLARVKAALADGVPD